jgi:hypothetical protein
VLKPNDPRSGHRPETCLEVQLVSLERSRRDRGRCRRCPGQTGTNPHWSRVLETVSGGVTAELWREKGADRDGSGTTIQGARLEIQSIGAVEGRSGKTTIRQAADSGSDIETFLDVAIAARGMVGTSKARSAHTSLLMSTTSPFRTIPGPPRVQRRSHCLRRARVDSFALDFGILHFYTTKVTF